MASLLQLADKYDVAVLRRTCALFLAYRKAELNLTEPLSSPRNPIMAASMLDRFCVGDAGAAPYAAAGRPLVTPRPHICPYHHRTCLPIPVDRDFPDGDRCQGMPGVHHGGSKREAS